jgi:hypothetical protein
MSIGQHTLDVEVVSEVSSEVQLIVMNELLQRVRVVGQVRRSQTFASPRPPFVDRDEPTFCLPAYQS